MREDLTHWARYVRAELVSRAEAGRRAARAHEEPAATKHRRLAGAFDRMVQVLDDEMGPGAPAKCQILDSCVCARPCDCSSEPAQGSFLCEHCVWSTVHDDPNGCA